MDGHGGAYAEFSDFIEYNATTALSPPPMISEMPSGPELVSLSQGTKNVFRSYAQLTFPLSYSLL